MSKTNYVGDNLTASNDIRSDGTMESNDTLTVKASIDSVSNTIVSGDGLRIGSSGPQQINQSQVTDIRYQIPYQAIDKTGSKKIFTAEAQAEVTEDRQTVFDTQCTSPSTAEITAAKNEIVNAIYVKTDGDVNNLTFRIISQPSGKIVLSYPDKFRYASNEGVNLIGAGTHKLDLYYVDSVSPTRFLNGQNLTVESKWDSSPGTILGNSSNVPWYQIDIQEFVYAEREVFSPDDKTKLDGLSGSTYLGIYANLAALQSAHPTANIGDTATVTDPTSNLFYWDGDSWEDTGTGYNGDMLKTIYDPTGVNGNAFSMSNMIEGPTSKVMTLFERSKLNDIEDSAEVNNISDTNAADLTDSGESTLHYHDSDRDRANHTGTQIASTISDFDTEVSNNSSVVANTNKVTNATHTGDVTGSDALTIANDAVTYAKMQNVVNDERILGRVSGADGIVEELTATEVRSMISVEDGSEANNISDVDATDLTDAGDSTLHYHSADRNRANHTGTQIHETISDYDTELAGTTNTTSFTPTADYHPATKKYVDDNAGGTGLFISFGPNDALFPSTNPASAFSRNSHPILNYDDTTAEKVDFKSNIQSSYTSDDIKIDIDWVAETATSGAVTWGVQFERKTPGGNNIDSDSFATQQTGNSTTSGASGVITRTTITLTQAQADGVSANDYFRMRVERVTSDGGDTMTDDAQILSVIVRI